MTPQERARKIMAEFHRCSDTEISVADVQFLLRRITQEIELAVQISVKECKP